MDPTQISMLFCPRGFLPQVFSSLRSNRTSIVSGCSDPLSLLLSFMLVFFTCIFSFFFFLILFLLVFQLILYDIFVFGIQWKNPPNWQDMFVPGAFGPKLWTIQPNWCGMFVYGDFCPKLQIHQPNWHDVLYTRESLDQSSGHSSPV